MKLNTLPKVAVTALLARMADEQTARYFYEAAAAYCRVNGYDKAEKHFLAEAKSENDHYARIVSFLSDWGVIIDFPAIKAPVTSFTDFLDLLSKAYQMEFDLLESYEEDALTVMQECMNTFGLIQEYINIQNESVIEYANMITKAEKYLPTDKNLVLFEAEVFE